MKIKVILTVYRGVDKKEEVRRELAFLKDITGEEPKADYGEDISHAVFEGEFHEFYQRVENSIMAKQNAPAASERK